MQKTIIEVIAKASALARDKLKVHEVLLKKFKRLIYYTIIFGVFVSFARSSLPTKGDLRDFKAESVPQSAPVQNSDWAGLRKSAAKDLDGQTVRIAGFMVPLEDASERVTEFLLVPYPGACIHTPAPPANQIIHVKLAPGVGIPYTAVEPIFTVGKLRIVTTRNIYTTSAYEMSLLRVEPYTESSL